MDKRMSQQNSKDKISLGWSPTGYAIACISLGLVLFLAVNLFASLGFRSARIDLTQERLFTLSQGTIDTLASLQEPITLKFYYSEGLLADRQRLQAYGTRVRNLLSEYVAHANGNLILEIIDPEPFTEQEDEAVAFGLARAQIGPDQIFFGLVGTNSIDGQEVVPFFVRDRDDFLEYDLTQIISRLNQTHRPVLGIVTNLPMDTGAVGFAAVEQGATAQPYFVYQQMQAAFEIQFLEQDFDEVPTSVDVLMVAHPRELDDRTLYAIDQFVLAGGRALIFVDPYSEVSLVPGPTGQPIQGATESSSLQPLLNAWGIETQEEMIVADRTAAAMVPADFDARRREMRYVAWLALGSEHSNTTEVVTESLQRGLNLSTVGALQRTAASTTEMFPLIISSRDSMLIPVDEVRYEPDMVRLLREFEPTDDSYVLAARLSGDVNTAFPDGQPAEQSVSDEIRNLETPDPVAAHLGRSIRPINVIVTADSDIFDDAIYVGQVDTGNGPQKVSGRDNDAFILNAIDFLMGSNNLMSLRARAISERPFVVVQDLRRAAEERFLEEEQILRTSLEEVDQRLRELRGQVRGMGRDAAPELNARRNQELARFQQQQVEIRQRLREVQRSLRSEIESLGFKVKALNTVLIPLMIALFAIGLAINARVSRARRLKGRV